MKTPKPTIKQAFSILLMLSACFFFCTCEKIERNNPWDGKADIDPKSWAPTDLELKTVNITTKQLNWKYGEHNIEGFIIERQNNSDDFQVKDTLSSQETSWTDSFVNPDPETTFRYRVYAFAGTNTSARIYSEPVNGGELPKPGKFEISDVNPSENTFTLSWTYEGNDGHDGFIINRVSEDDELIRIPIDNPFTTSYTEHLENVSDSDSYTYSVKAYFDECVSDPSNTITIARPVMFTGEIPVIGRSFAYGRGKVLSEGTFSVLGRGFVLSTNADPTIDDNERDVAAEDGAEGAFMIKIEGLEAETQYYIRAYATNFMGTAYGAQKQFKTTAKAGDNNGNEYHTVIVDNGNNKTEWFSENLRVKSYSNGASIATALNNTQWQNTASGAYSVFPYHEVAGVNSEEQMVEAYGLLYNWYAVNSNNLCPSGWRVPSSSDWNSLVEFLTDMFEPVSSSDVGNAMKSCRQVNSPMDNGCSTNEHPRWNAHSANHGMDIIGFAALPGGLRTETGDYINIGEYGYWWTSDQYYDKALDEMLAWYRILGKNHGDIVSTAFYKSMGLSVRCVRNAD